MRYKLLTRPFSALAFALLCVLSSKPGFTQDVIISETSFVRDDSTMVLEFRRFSSLLGRQGATIVQAFGNGTVKVTLPPTHRDAGTYVMNMTSSELDALIANTIQTSQIQEPREPSVASQGDTLFAVSDSTVTEIDLAVVSYALNAAENISLNTSVNISANDILLSNQQRPGSTRLASLAELENQLLSLANDSRLVKQ